MRSTNHSRAWRPAELQRRVGEVARRMAEKEAARIPWSQLLQARRLYVKWQAFLLWVRAIEDSEGQAPAGLREVVKKRCPDFERVVSERKSRGCGHALCLWQRLGQWINDRVFAKPRREGWMNAVGYYAVRDLAALRDEAYWSYCEQQWKLSKPAVYSSFQEWRKASEQCSDEALYNFEITEDLRELVSLSRRVSPRTLRKTVDQYLESLGFAYWARTALDQGDRLPDPVKHELRRRCPGFLETAAWPRGNGESETENRFGRLLRWIEEHEFARAIKEGWLPVLVYQVRLHPRHARLIDYWRHWQRIRSRHPRARYPSFEQLTAAADACTFDPEKS